MDIYIVTDLLLTEGAYRFNAVYAFKSKTSVKSYQRYLKPTIQEHRLVVMPVKVPDGVDSVIVITEFDAGSSEYRATSVFDDWDDARDYVQDLREEKPTVRTEYDAVRIRSRFTPGILHSGWA